MNLDEIEINYEKGTLLIQADKKEESEDRNKKFYRRAHKSYCYNLTVPGKVDGSHEPSATYTDGILHICFQKEKDTCQKKKISIKRG
jgi:HSP20 family protein